MFEFDGKARVAGIAGLILLLLACGPPEDSGSATSADETPETPAGDEKVLAGSPVRGDWLVNHLLADPENLNPLTANDSASSSVTSWIFLSLLDLDNETLDQRPLIARELPEISEDKWIQYNCKEDSAHKKEQE